MRRKEQASSNAASVPSQAKAVSRRRAPSNSYPPDWDRLWGHFEGMHGTWLEKLRLEDPVYALPAAVIDALTRAAPGQGKRRRVQPLISEADATAERHFATICRCYHPGTVGVWKGKPVIYPLLRHHWSALQVDESIRQMLIRQELVDEAQIQRLPQRGHAGLERADHQMLGYLGYLLLNPSFRQEVADLKAAWRRVKGKTVHVASTAEKMPGCTLGPIQGYLLSAGAKRPSPRVKMYQDMLVALCRKWYLREMVTFDLPVPWPPFSVTSVFDVWLLVDRRAPVFFHAPYSELPSDVELRARMNIWKRDAARRSFVDSPRDQEQPDAGPDVLPVKRLAGRDGHPSEYETAFRMSFVEMSVGRRYGSQYGLANRMLEAFHTMHKMSNDRLKKLRLRYASSSAAD